MSTAIETIGGEDVAPEPDDDEYDAQVDEAREALEHGATWAQIAAIFAGEQDDELD